MSRRPHTAMLLTAALAATTLGGCALPVVLGAGAAAGYVGLQQRPTQQIAADTQLKLSIKDHLSALKFEYLGDIGIDVFYGNVLVTGIVPTQAEGDKVIDIVRRTEGVKKVYNELFVGAAYSAAQKAKDAWIATQLQPRLIGTEDAYPLNYLTTVVNNHVYIMGSVETAAEKEHVLHVIRTTRGVQQVHDYLVLIPAPANTHKNTDTQTLNSGTLRAPNPFPDMPENPK